MSVGAAMGSQVELVERISEDEVFAAQIRQAELVGQLMHRLQELEALVRKQHETLQSLRTQRMGRNPHSAAD